DLFVLLAQLFHLGFVCRAGSRRRAAALRCSRSTARAFDLFESESLAVARSDGNLARDLTSGFHARNKIRSGCRMAGGDYVSTGKRKSGKNKLAFLVCFGLKLGGHVRAENVDLSISERDLLTVCLLHKNMTAELADLCKGC